MKKPIKDVFVLALACIYETVRQTGVGPTSEEIKQLLFAVYGVTDLTEEKLEQTLQKLTINHIQEDQSNGRYYPVVAGVFTFIKVRERIIPPQTVAQTQIRKGRI